MILNRVSGTRNVAPMSGTTSGSTSTVIPAMITVNSNGQITTEYGSFIVSDTTGNPVSTLKGSTSNTGNLINNPTGNDPTSIDQTLFSTTDERKLASAYFAGGVGIEKDLAVGGFIYGRISVANSATTSTEVIVQPNNNNQTFYPVFTDASGLQMQGAFLYGDNTGYDGGLTYNAFTGQLITDQLLVAQPSNSTSTTTGALTVAGGVGIGEDVVVGGGVYPSNTATTSTNTIGAQTRPWATAYLNNIYSNFLGNSSGNINISPNSGINFPNGGNGGTLDVFGNIRVRGENPIGTAPVVTNILYVTMDGDDTNDGRAMDPSRACRTISGAVNSPYYQSGTQIRVAPGHYLENNPIQLKPYTSIMGSDLRTTGVEPINKTQDLFHMNSGCYLAFMQFLNGRSGLLPGNNYINGTNRGAYCTAFPPLTGDARINLFHSPYIQNCTNLSGPWLVDGSMFVPDETIQVPIAVGTGSWTANTTTIVVNVDKLPINGFINAGIPGSGTTQYSTTGTLGLQRTVNIITTLTNSSLLSSITRPSLNDGYITVDTGNLWVQTNAETISLGMAVTPGQQNTGFFNARTLMLANKPFLQSQIVSYIDKVFNNGITFSYNTSTCYRDVGLIVDVIGMDLLHGSTSDSTFTGLQYWSQDLGYTGKIPSEITATKAAITYLEGLAVAYVSAGNQSRVNTLFGYISTILNSGPSGITNAILVGNAPTTSTSILSDIAALQANLTTMQSSVVSWVSSNYPSLQYNTSTCYRDVGYIINSICFDMASGGNLQSIKSGVYYYAYDANSTQIPNEIPQTTAAYSFIQSIIPKIVSATLIASPYQSEVTQITNGTPATSEEINILQSNIEVITSIITSGPIVAGTKTPQNLNLSPDANAINAWNLLEANKAFIQAEVLAFISKTFTGTFNYNKQLSYRDTGILIENIAYDVAFGGNEKSREAGLAYWNGVVSYIATETPQCIAAINYLGDLLQSVIINSTCTVLPSVAGIPTANQVINTVMTGGVIASPSIDNAVSTIINIIANGPTAAPTLYNSSGPDAAYASAEILLQANRQFIQENTINYINWKLVGNQPSTYLPFNQIKCSRDTGIIVDSIASDLLFPTPQYSQTTFAGLQYYSQNGYTGNISTEITTTTAAVKYLQTIASKVVRNITAAQDAVLGFSRYGNNSIQSLQVTNIEPGTSAEVATINSEFNIITSILSGNTTGWTDQVIPNNTASNLKSVQDSYSLLIANIPYMQQEVYSYITSPTGLNYPAKYFTTATCIRDIGYIIDSVSFDLMYGGNRQAIQSGLSYYQQSLTSSVIPKETSATVSAFNFLGKVIGAFVTGTNYTPLQTTVLPVLGLPTATTVPVQITNAVNSLTNIIANGPAGYEFTPISLTASSSTNVTNAFNIIKSNKAFFVAEVNAWLNQTYNAGAFVYNQDYCYRDIGLMVDAVSQDIILGGNQRSIEAGLSYWNQGYNYIANEITTTTQAIAYISSIAQQIIANTTVTSITGTVATQVINPFFAYGGNYMPQQAVTRNFGIISNIIANGPNAAPPVYAGSGLFALTGLNGADVQVSPTVTYISTISTGTYLIGLSTSTIGFGNNSTIYFGNTYVWPLQNSEVETLSLKQTGNNSSWNQRKVDPIGGMGGSLVDGAVISDKSPIQSFVYDAFTQLTQGGVGVHITNNGYAQLVSVFTIFASVGVQVDNGGIASIVNSNANFGNLCLVAKGYGTRKFSGTIYNPSNRAYPFSPGVNGLDQYYPDGFWPSKGTIEVFVPDTANRPHISLVMEIIPPKGYINGYNSTSLESLGVTIPGFLNAQPSTGTLISGTIELIDIDTTNVYIDNSVTIIDQFGYPYDNFQYLHDAFGNYLDQYGNITTTSSNYISNPAYKIWYCATGTYVTDVNYNSISLSTALTSSGDYPTDPNYFTIYFSGNSYYTVVTSNTANNPYQPNTNILAVNSNTNYQGPNRSQISAHVAAMKYLNTITNLIVSNKLVKRSEFNTSTQYINNSLTDGSGSISFINVEFNNLTNIVGATDLNAGLSVIPSGDISQKGTIPSGAGSAVTLIQNNIEFLSDEIVSWVNSNYPAVFNTFNTCYRDTGLIVDTIGMDMLYNSSSDSTFAGLQYWSQDLGYVGAIPTESTATIAAIDYLKSLVVNAVSNNSTGTVADLFNQINNILVNGPFDITNNITFGGLPTTSTQTLSDVATLQANKTNYEIDVTNWLTTYYPLLSYDINKCRRDVGYIIDSICFDLTNGGNVQSTKSGVYYYSYDSTATVIINETTATVAAYNYIRNILIPNVVQGFTSWSPYQTTVTQIITDTPATGVEVGILQSKIDTITSIITGGPSVAPTKTPQSLTENGSTNIINAWKILHDNRAFIQAEVTAYVNANYSDVYNTFGMTDGQALKCRRDVGLTLQQLIYDLETGGNYNMVYAGLSYWSRPGTYHIVELGEAVTDPTLFPDGSTVNFYQRSYISASGYVFEYVGAGTNYGALPQNGIADPVQGHETVQLDSGKVFFTSTDQNGDFRIGPGLVISQATGVISGRTFTESLFANLTPFILAIEAL